MNDEDLSYFEELLISRRDHIVEQLERLEELGKTNRKDSSGDLSAYSWHPADQATDAMEREVAFHFVALDGNYLHHLEEALTRIEDGTFGICRLCGQDIDRERLEAVPHTTLCIACKSEEERQRREPPNRSNGRKGK